MIKAEKNYALITGATSGIGYELAKQCAADGYNVILVARIQALLDDAASDIRKAYGREVIVIAKDLFGQEAAEEIYQFTTQAGLQVDVLINDAGQGQWRAFTDTDLQHELDIIQLNIVALVSLTKYYAKDMVARRHGHILQVASSVSKTPNPLLSVYAATKAFVLSFAEALRDELKDTGVTVTALQPYATDTDFFHKAQAENTDIYENGSLSDPAEVAEAGYSGMLDGSATVLPGFINKM